VSAKVVSLQILARPERVGAAPAQVYNFTGTDALLNQSFLEKTAASEEISDRLIAADHNDLTAAEIERRIQYFVQAYLSVNWADNP
jgi:hypothetical protein